MDFFSVVLFLAMYYLRPQDWGGALSSIHFVQLTMVLSVFALLNRTKSVRFKDLFRTPHDYATLLFFAWLVLTSGSPVATFKQVANLMVFYIVIVQTLNSLQRIRLFLVWWCVFILAVTALALLSEHGFDPFNSFDITHGRMKDRLVLNFSIFNNPNALAHSIVPVIPMLYFLLFWKRTVALKPLALGVLLLPLYCIFLTVSKGAFITGFVTMIATLMFGRPKIVQGLIIFLAIAFGYGALTQLPRMHELNQAKTDEAIQGRIAAYTYGYKCVTTMWAGIGYGNWIQSFYNQSRQYTLVKRTRRLSNNKVVMVRKRVAEHYIKATHGTYNNIGSELGFTGLVLFMGMTWCSLRTLLTVRLEDPEEERIRRILFVLMITYLVSSWMVDFGYRPTFFMFTAATAAFHRHLRGIYREREEETEEVVLPWRAKRSLPAPAPVGFEHLPPAPSALALAQAEPLGVVALALERPALSVSQPLLARSLQRFREFQPRKLITHKLRPVETPSEVNAIVPRIAWNRLGPADFLIALALSYVILKIWAHLITAF